MPTNGLRYLRRVAALLAAGGVLAAGLLFALRAELPDTFVLEQGQPLAVESMPFLQAAPAVPAGSAAPAGVTAADKSANVTLTLLGLPGVRLLSDSAFQVWLCMAGLTFAIYRRQKQWMVGFTFLLAIWFTCLLGPVALMRYVLALFYTVPVLLAAMLAPQGKPAQE